MWDKVGSSPPPPLLSLETHILLAQSIGLTGLKNPVITDRLFEVFDSNKSGEIDFKEFVGAMSVMCRGSWHEKLKCV